MESDTFSFLNLERRYPMPDEVLTIKEAAALLKLAEKTVYTMAQAGEIPAFKIRGQWRITRTEFDRWLAAQSRGNKAGGGPHGR
jgi:excisionase family DNA binding protein